MKGCSWGDGGQRPCQQTMMDVRHDKQAHSADGCLTSGLSSCQIDSRRPEQACDCEKDGRLPGSSVIDELDGKHYWNEQGVNLSYLRGPVPPLWPGNRSIFKHATLIKTHLSLDKDDRHFADDIFKRISLNANVWILISTSLKSVPKLKGTIDNNWASVRVMAWHRTGDKPLSESMLTQFPDAYMGH